MFYILFILVGAAIGYIVAPKVGLQQKIAAGLGAGGGLIGGVILKAVLPFMLGLVGAAVGALALIYGYRELRKRT
jgi:hypothetical protein